MQLLHSPARTRAVFDDPNLLAHAGLAPLLTLAGRAGLPDLLAGAQPAGPCGASAVTKAMCLIAGMAAGADSIGDMDLLRDGATMALVKAKIDTSGPILRRAGFDAYGQEPAYDIPL